MTPTAYTLSRRDTLLGVDNISVKIVRISSDADRCGSWVVPGQIATARCLPGEDALKAVYESPTVTYADGGHATRRPLRFRSQTVKFPRARTYNESDWKYSRLRRPLFLFRSLPAGRSRPLASAASSTQLIRPEP